MKLSDIKNILPTLEDIHFILPDGTTVPEHFHVTEVGVVTKHFVDCGGVERMDRVVNFQLWNARDIDHRLKPQKLLDIIALCEKSIGSEDLEVEVEYQGTTIEKYGLLFRDDAFLLTPKQTNCLAPDKCNISPDQMPEKKSCCCGGAC